MIERVLSVVLVIEGYSTKIKKNTETVPSACSTLAVSDSTLPSANGKRVSIMLKGQHTNWKFSRFVATPILNKHLHVFPFWTVMKKSLHVVDRYEASGDGFGSCRAEILRAEATTTG